MLHLILALTALLTALPSMTLGAGSPSPSPAPWNLQIFFSNDVHGKTEPCG